MLPPCKVVAEIGCAHLGDIKRAKELIESAKWCGADYAKFQKRNPHESTPDNLKHKPHPNQHFAYGETYLKHRLNLELSIIQHAELKQFCEDAGIKYATSVWDLSSANEIISLAPDYIKVPSAKNQDRALLNLLFERFSGPIHISLGMLEDNEKEWLYSFCQDQNVVFYHCTSSYPCPFEDIHLMEIQDLIDRFDEVGFSNHGYGIAIDDLAYLLGATWIERHFVDDRCLRHTDAAASLEPDGLRRVCRDLKQARKALQYRDKMPDSERQQRAKFKSA